LPHDHIRPRNAAIERARRGAKCGVRIMTDAVTAPLLVMVGFPIAAALWAFVAQLTAVHDRKQRSGKGWDARDTFEVKDALFANAAFILPIMVGAAFLAADLDWPRWAWWGSLLVLAAACVPISNAYSCWSSAQRKAFEVNKAGAESRNGSQP
jgi:TRAP-type uncharacterized transport system fused permease subunit